jgi:hypothetical protein
MHSRKKTETNRSVIKWIYLQLPSGRAWMWVQCDVRRKGRSAVQFVPCANVLIHSNRPCLYRPANRLLAGACFSSVWYQHSFRMNTRFSVVKQFSAVYNIIVFQIHSQPYGDPFSSITPSVHPSERMKQIENNWKDFYEIWYLRKIVHPFQVIFRWGNFNDNFAGRSTCVSAPLQSIALSIYGRKNI